jgi:hypothetical protein
MSVCCSDGVFISGEYQPLSQRLLSYGMEAYKDVKKRQRVVMWVFMFYDESAMCPACKQSYSEMFAWFHKYNLFDDPVRCVRTVIEPEPKKNLIYTDLGMNKLPTVVFADEKCRILDILFEFPGTKWLEQYVLPFIQDDGKLA